MNKIFQFLLIGAFLSSTGCATAKSESTTASPPIPQQVQTQPPEQEEPAGKEPLLQEPPAEEPPGDEEDALFYRVLAAPEYLWEGITWPIKKMSIFYERVDLLERALDLFLNEDRTGGVYPIFALGGVISTGIGFTAFENNLFNNKNKQARLSYLFGVRGNQVGNVSYTDAAVFDSRFKFETELNGVNFDEGFFFPGGNTASEIEDETLFSLLQVSPVAKVSYPTTGDLSAAFLARYFVARGEQSDNPGRQIPLNTPGVDVTIQAIEFEPGLRYDTRDNPFDPTTGWFLNALFTYTNQVNGDEFDYFGYTLEAQRYIPLFGENRILLLRGLLAKQTPIGDAFIPFYELNTLDLNRGLRGFRRGRWRDQGRFVLNAEWRFPVWEGFDGSIFYDAGQVFGQFSDLEIRTFRYSAGFGFRFATTRQFAFRAHVAWSEDGVLALIRGDLEFLQRRGAYLGTL